MFGVLYTTIVSIFKKWTKLRTLDQVTEEKKDLADRLIEAIEGDKNSVPMLEKVRWVLVEKGLNSQAQRISNLINVIKKPPSEPK